MNSLSVMHSAWWKKDIVEERQQCLRLWNLFDSSRTEQSNCPKNHYLHKAGQMSPFLSLPKNNFQISSVQARGRRALPLSHGWHCHHCSHCRSTWKYDDNKWRHQMSWWPCSRTARPASPLRTWWTGWYWAWGLGDRPEVRYLYTVLVVVGWL